MRSSHSFVGEMKSKRLCSQNVQYSAQSSGEMQLYCHTWLMWAPPPTTPPIHPFHPSSILVYEGDRGDKMAFRVREKRMEVTKKQEGETDGGCFPPRRSLNSSHPSRSSVRVKQLKQASSVPLMEEERLPHLLFILCHPVTIRTFFQPSCRWSSRLQMWMHVCH